MKLLLNKTSPYARVVRIALLEKDLTDKVELCWVDPWADDQELVKHNPIARIPTLVLGSKIGSGVGSEIAISESLLMLQYLNAIETSVSLFPHEKLAETLHLLGIAQGMMDAAFSKVISNKYLDNRADVSVLSDRQDAALQRALIQLEGTLLPVLENTLNAAEIALGVALEYIDFRLPELALEVKFPKLHRWRNTVTGFSSFQGTAFQ